MCRRWAVTSSYERMPNCKIPKHSSQPAVGRSCGINTPESPSTYGTSLEAISTSFLRISVGLSPFLTGLTSFIPISFSPLPFMFPMPPTCASWVHFQTIYLHWYPCPKLSFLENPKQDLCCRGRLLSEYRFGWYTTLMYMQLIPLSCFFIIYCETFQIVLYMYLPEKFR